MTDLVKTSLVRSLCIAAAFAATLVVYILAGQAPERSGWDWIALGLVLSLLALVAGVLATSMEMRQR